MKVWQVAFGEIHVNDVGVRAIPVVWNGWRGDCLVPMVMSLSKRGSPGYVCKSGVAGSSWTRELNRYAGSSHRFSRSEEGSER
ncbi:MAG: hypothetical protein HFG32_03550 [Eubacterium sp.]|nr:hypothetical protein [Eubacterium sp.]